MGPIEQNRPQYDNASRREDRPQNYQDDSKQGNKKYLVYLAKYLGVALISGSVVHIGTLSTGIIRYAILMVIGVVLMLIGHISEAKQIGIKINLKFLLIIASLSIATGFLSGGVQHYLDNPVYAGYLLAIGAVVAYATFFLKDKISIKKRDIFVVITIALGILFVSNFLMHDFVEHGHSDTKTHN